MRGIFKLVELKKIHWQYESQSTPELVNMVLAALSSTSGKPTNLLKLLQPTHVQPVNNSSAPELRAEITLLVTGNE